MMTNPFARRLAPLAFLAAFAAPVSAQIAYGLTDENDLVAFDLTSPTNLLSGGPVTGLGGQDLIGIDFRPADGKLYGVGNFGGVFTIDTATFAASLVSALSVPLSGSRYGVDFNPVADRLRIVSDTDQNLRVNVATGAVTVDGTISAPGDETLTSAAYTNSDRDPATGTTLYALNARGGITELMTTTNPNGGAYTAVGSLGNVFTSLSGFDIVTMGGVNSAYGILQPKGEGYSSLYSINLATGAATVVGSVGGGDLFDGFAIAPVPEPATMAALALGAAAFVRRRRA